MESIVVWLLLLTAVIAQGHSSPGTAANEYYVGFFKNIAPGPLTLYITTTESAPVPFTVSSSTGQIYSGAATNSVVINVTLPSSFAVFNNTIRDGGVWIHAIDASRKLTVYGINDNTGNSIDGFVALPCHDYQKQNYTYYAVSTYFGRRVRNPEERPISEVLLVGCEDSTELIITPTQTIEIPSDLVRGSSSPISVTSGGSYTVTLNRLQTFMFHSTLDLTGSKVVSNKPIAFFSGHECADVPVGVGHCDHLVEQLPPTITWGRRLFIASSLGKTAGEQYKLTTLAATTTVICYCYTSGGTVSETFINTFNGAGRSHEFYIAQNMFCSIQASSPIVLVQFAIGRSLEPSEYGDPFMMMIPPVEQYGNNYTFVTQSGFENAITVTVASEFFNPEDIILNGHSLNGATWTEIYCSTQTVCGYGTRVSVSVERNFIYHRAPTAKIGTFVYGFRQRTSYGYPAGMQLAPISVDCGYPVAPWNGTLESYTSTTNGSEVFYSCDPGLLPEGRMRAVCTENGWSPNPSDLNCTIETSLDSRAQPVATEHAVPSSLPQAHLPLAIGLAVSGMSIVIVTPFIMVWCFIMKRRPARNMATSDTQGEQMDIKMKEAVVHEYENVAHEYEDVEHEYEVPFSVKECEAYATLPYKP